MTTRSLMLFTTLFTMAVLLNLMGCLWWNVAAGQGLDTSWASPERKRAAPPAAAAASGRREEG